MAGFEIPDELIPGFAELDELSDSDYEKLIQITKDADVGTGPQTLEKLFIGKLSNTSEVLQHVIFSFGSLLLRNEGASIEELGIKLAKSYKEDASTKLIARISEILNESVNFKLTMKAVVLIRENSHVYNDARIITDIRTIFNNDLEDEKRHAVIFHNLKLNYQENEKEKEFYLSLDNTDLIKLKEIIERAIKKEKEIRKDYHHSFRFITLND